MSSSKELTITELHYVASAVSLSNAENIPALHSADLAICIRIGFFYNKEATIRKYEAIGLLNAGQQCSLIRCWMPLSTYNECFQTILLNIVTQNDPINLLNLALLSVLNNLVTVNVKLSFLVWHWHNDIPQANVVIEVSIMRNTTTHSNQKNVLNVAKSTYK